MKKYLPNVIEWFIAICVGIVVYALRLLFIPDHLIEWYYTGIVVALLATGYMSLRRKS